jgi:hypothetical protein
VSRRKRRTAATAIAATLVVIAALASSWYRHPFAAAPTIVVVPSHNETGAPARARLAKGGHPVRNLFHQGGLVFNPSGAEAVRIRLSLAAGVAQSVVVEDGLVVTRANRV